MGPETGSRRSFRVRDSKTANPQRILADQAAVSRRSSSSTASGPCRIAFAMLVSTRANLPLHSWQQGTSRWCGLVVVPFASLTSKRSVAERGNHLGKKCSSDRFAGIRAWPHRKQVSCVSACLAAMAAHCHTAVPSQSPWLRILLAWSSASRPLVPTHNARLAQGGGPRILTCRAAGRVGAESDSAVGATPGSALVAGVCDALLRPFSAHVSPPRDRLRIVSDVDIAKLKRLRASVSSSLQSVPEKSAHGLPPTYNALRQQVLEAVPTGLRDEVGAIAPEVASTGRGPHAVIEAARDGARAYAHLAALKGWLDAVIDAG